QLVRGLSHMEMASGCLEGAQGIQWWKMALLQSLGCFLGIYVRIVPGKGRPVQLPSGKYSEEGMGGR
ncbi:MAG: hypothetical protein J0626_08615, partial [Rhodospirillaceae bacterium]|nr:hypothetical protein [Rhodospirillaceae bacterium]